MLRLACCWTTGIYSTDSPCQAASCKSDATSPHWQLTRHLTCPTPRHHLRPAPHTNCSTSYTSPEPAFANGYFCLSRARKGGTAKKRDRKTFRRRDFSAGLSIAYMDLFVLCSHFKNLSTHIQLPVATDTRLHIVRFTAWRSTGVLYCQGTHLHLTPLTVYDIPCACFHKTHK